MVSFLVGELTIEISVLSVPKQLEVDDTIQYLDLIKIGRDGLIVEKGYYKGLLLPQVFTEYESTPKQALEMTCQKAGLPKQMWKEKDTRILSFHSQVFSEKEPHGEIEKIM